MENNANDVNHKNDFDVSKPVWYYLQDRHRAVLLSEKLLSIKLPFQRCISRPILTRGVILISAIAKMVPQIEWTELEASNQHFLCLVEPIKSNAKVIVRKDSYS